MNKARRKRLEKALEMIAEARDIIEEVKDEERDAFDNLPENLQESDLGMVLEANSCELEMYLDDLDEVRDNIEEILCP